MKDRIVQIRLPRPDDTDIHPRLMVGNRGIRAGDVYTALFPDGWHRISIEMSWELTGPESWFIATSGYQDFSPIGLFVNLDA